MRRHRAYGPCISDFCIPLKYVYLDKQRGTFFREIDVVVAAVVDMRECLLQMKFRDVNVFIVVIFDRVTQIGVHKGVNDGLSPLRRGFKIHTIGDE